MHHTLLRTKLLNCLNFNGSTQHFHHKEITQQAKKEGEGKNRAREHSEQWIGICDNKTPRPSDPNKQLLQI